MEEQIKLIGYGIDLLILNLLGKNNFYDTSNWSIAFKCIFMELEIARFTWKIYAKPSNFKVSECLFFTDRIKQGSQFDVILLYS